MELNPICLNVSSLKVCSRFFTFSDQHFADDANLVNINKSPQKLNKVINADLTKWLNANKIS